MSDNFPPSNLPNDPWLRAVDDFTNFARETEKEWGMLGEIFMSTFQELGVDIDKIYALIWHCRCEWDI